LSVRSGSEEEADKLEDEPKGDCSSLSGHSDEWDDYESANNFGEFEESEEMIDTTAKGQPSSPALELSDLVTVLSTEICGVKVKC